MNLLLLVLAIGQPDGDQPAVREGMTAAKARAALGIPQQVSRQILAHRVVEYWHYGAPRPYRLVIDCLRGQPPRVIAVHTP